jgi:hypothetical protein
MLMGTLALVASLTPVAASAQSADLRPGLTAAEFEEFVAGFDSILRFRQLGDATPVGRGNIDVGVHYASTPADDPISFPRVIGRVGVSDRVDIGVWGGANPRSNWGLAGFDTKIALLQQDTRMPVSVAIRPSVTSLVGPSHVWVGNASIDVSMSRALGALSPYVGVATTASVGIERSRGIDLDPATVEGSLAYVGISYRWRALVASAEVENADHVSYGFRIGTRF